MVEGASDVQFQCMTTSWGSIPNSKSSNGWTAVDTEGSEITIVLDESVLSQEICFQVNNMYITKVTIRDAEEIDYYVGDNGEGATIALSDLTDIGADVTVEIEFRMLDGFGYYQIFLQEKAGSWSYLTADKYVGTYNMNSYGCFELTEEGTLTATISKDTIDALAGALKVGVYGVIIDNVTVSAAE